MGKITHQEIADRLKRMQDNRAWTPGAIQIVLLGIARRLIAFATSLLKILRRTILPHRTLLRRRTPHRTLLRRRILHRTLLHRRILFRMKSRDITCFLGSTLRLARPVQTIGSTLAVGTPFSLRSMNWNLQIWRLLVQLSNGSRLAAEITMEF